MKSLAFVRILPLLVAAQLALGQAPSALEPFLSAAPLLQRSPAFAEMQNSIETELGDAEPGAQLDLLTDLIDSLRATVNVLLTPPKLAEHRDSDDTTNNFQITKLMPHPLDTLEVPFHVITKNQKIHPGDLVDTARAKLKSELESKEADLKAQLASRLGKDAKARAMLLEVLRRLRVVGVKVDIDDDATAKDLAGKLVDVLADSVVQKQVDALAARLKNALPDSVTVQDALEAFNGKAEQLFAEQATRVNAELDRAQGTLQEAVDRFHNALVEANIGIATKKYEGSASAGVMISVVKWPRVCANKANSCLLPKKSPLFRSYAVGLFLGHQVNPSDTTQTITSSADGANAESPGTDTTITADDRSVSLVGASLRLQVLPRVEVSTQVAKLLGNEVSHAWEAGGGLSVNLGGNIRIGGGYFKQSGLGDRDFRTYSNAGVWVGRVNKSSPTAYLGVIAPDDDFTATLKPVVKLSLPFFALK